MKIKKIDLVRLEILKSYHNIFITENIQLIDIYSNIFDTIINKLIEYHTKKREFGSTQHLSTSLYEDCNNMSYSNVVDFMDIFELIFDFFDDHNFFNFKKRISIDILQLKNFKLLDIKKIFDNTTDLNSYIRKEKLNKISNNDNR